LANTPAPINLTTSRDGYSDIKPLVVSPEKLSLPTKVRKAYVSAALLTGKLDIADAPISQVILEFVQHGLSEWKVSALKDTGADVDMVSKSLVDRLVNQGFVTPFKLDVPIQLGAIDVAHALTITHAVLLPIREGDMFYEHIFGIADIPSPPHLIMGQPWHQKFVPDALEIINKFGYTEISTREAHQQTKFQYGLPTPTNSPPLSPKLRPITPEKPILCPPCKDPITAFSAGGGNSLLAALESEDYRRKDLVQKHAACLRVQITIEHLLAEKEHTARVRAAAATGSNDPGVRGLTGNKEGWLDTIPEEYRIYADTIFSDNAANELPPFRPNSDCVINIREGQKLKASKLYDMSQEELTQLKALLDLELKRGFIRPSKSESSAPVFFVRDPSSGTRSGQLRLVVDYRDLNSKIKLDEYPIPMTRTIMNDLAGADWITSMDVRSGFSNLRMKPGSEAATAFKTFYGLFEYTVMPMGLATAPSIFQRFINSVLNPYLGIFCHAYLDDVVIYTKGSLEQHKEHVSKVLASLNENGLRLKPHKCKWFKRECDFLGFTVTCGKGVRMADDKIQGIRDIEPPRGVADLRSFLGVVGFYDKFIPHYSDITACLTNLTKKDVPWDWSPHCKEAFQKVLDAIRNDIYIRAFDWTKPIRLSTDASDAAYAGALEQEYEDGWKPFLLFHHKFKDAEKNWDIHDKELYAIYHAFSTYRHFLAQTAQPVQVFTDHRNLAKFMFSTNLLKSHDGRLGRWWETLSQYNFVINYLPGKDNILPDFLSRYGYDTSADLEPKILLPQNRFSSKALADIQSWFKKSDVTPNIRKLLEQKFATAPDGENQISSPVPVPEPTPISQTPARVPESSSAPAPAGPNPVRNSTPTNQGQTTVTLTPPFPARDRIPSAKLSLTGLSPRSQKLAHSYKLHEYNGNPLFEPSANHRTPGDHRGLGSNYQPPSVEDAD
jgi:hypothetical protein